MTTANVSASASAPSEASLSSQAALVESIVGVAIFDISGLPREYFVTAENESTSWVQLVFQALGLRSLLMSSLKLEGFSHIAIELEGQSAIVVRTKDEYVALLLRQPLIFATAQEGDRFSQWVRQFERRLLRDNPRFMPA